VTPTRIALPLVVGELNAALKDVYVFDVTSLFDAC